MAKELNWFKFSPLGWLTGRIKKESPKVQVAFMDLMCIYWKNGCKMTEEQAKLEIGEHLNRLVSRQIVKIDSGFIRVDFLDQQLNDIEEVSEQKRTAAKARWDAKKEVKNADAMHVHKVALQMHDGALQIDADREIDRKKDKREREDYYPNAQTAFEDITNNYHETEPQRNTLSNRGWKSVTKPEVDALLYHFLECQVDFETQEIRDIKSHFKRWLNKRPIEELQTLSKKIHERYQTQVR